MHVQPVAVARHADIGGMTVHVAGRQQVRRSTVTPWICGRWRHSRDEMRIERHDDGKVRPSSSRTVR